jgi:hypothetical protein
MVRPISSRTTVSLLKQDAKRWLNSLRQHDPTAQKRLRDAWPQAPDDPTLRDVQHALAREYGEQSWVALLDRLADMAVERQGRAEWLALVLSHGWTGDITTARRLASRHPELARDSLFAAAAMGNVTEVERHLKQSPASATATCDVRGWTALAHVAYGRLDEENALTIAQRLLDAGADIHFHFDDGWGNAFTLLTGVAGDGEGAKPPHPQAESLAALLLHGGVDPFDTQLLYNTSLHHDDTRWLDLLWSRSVARGIEAQWRATEGKRLSGRLSVNTLDYLLGNAVLRRHRARVQWLLEHGANANTLHAYSGRTVHTEARLAGFSEGVVLLEAHGARADSLPSSLEFAAAVMLNDADTVQRLLAAQPSLIRAPGPLHRAALQGRTEILRTLLDLGADIHAADHEGSTALHRAVQGGSVAAVMLLLDTGADINRREPRFQGTALSWAIALDQQEVATALVPRSRDIRALSRLGEVERLREVLQVTPDLVREELRGVDAPTALFCFADDDETAAEVVRELVRHGADRSVRDVQGRTAAEVARSRGLDGAAALLDGMEGEGR